MWYGLVYVDRLKVYTMGPESDFSVRNRFCLKGAMNGMNRNFSPSFHSLNTPLETKPDGWLRGVTIAVLLMYISPAD